MAVPFRSLCAFGLICLAVEVCATQPPVKPAPHIWLMGEVHDNPYAHESRYTLISQKVKAGWRPAIVLEQFDREHQDQLIKALEECKTASCITAKPWVEKWEWTLYLPLIQLAIDYQLPLLAANVSRADANRIVKEGYAAALDADMIAQYGLNKPLPDELEHRHSKNIMAGHCNILPPEVAAKMVPAQVARDVWMAKVIEQQARQSDVILIAGNGHVQKDVGVIQWLPVTLRESTTVHGFVEQQQAVEATDFDVLHRVPDFQREDPCEVFKTMTK